MRSTILLISLLIGLCIYFFPSALAVLRGSFYKGQVIKYQFIIFVISIMVVVLVACFGFIATPSSAGVEQHMTSQSAGVLTEDASAEVATPSANNMPGVKIITMLCVIGGGIWSLISIILWFYILLHALRDQRMTLLSRFGINI